MFVIVFWLNRIPEPQLKPGVMPGFHRLNCSFLDEFFLLYELKCFFREKLLKQLSVDILDRMKDFLLDCPCKHNGMNMGVPVWHNT